MLFDPSLALVAVLVTLAGCAEMGKPRSPTPTSQANSSSSASEPPQPIDLPCMQTSHGCIALNTDVTQESLEHTICAAGYTKTIRPSVGFANGLKARLLRQAGLDKSHMVDYELDHIIPIEVGGHSRKLSNLRLQTWWGEDGAVTKDVLEHRLQRMICSGQIKLADAQYCIGEDWHACRAGIAAGRVLSSGRVVTQSSPGTASTANTQ